MYVSGREKNKWFVFQTNSRQEKRVAVCLSRKQIVNYCPCILQISKKKQAPATKLAPLFPTYIFVHILPSELNKVLRIRGVQRILYSLGKHAQVSEDVIGLLKTVTQDGKILNVTKVNADFHTKESFVFGSEHHRGSYISFPNRPFDITFPGLGLRLEVEMNTFPADFILAGAAVAKSIEI